MTLKFNKDGSPKQPKVLNAWNMNYANYPKYTENKKDWEVYNTYIENNPSADPVTPS